MTVETADYINELDETMPLATDPLSEGDNQLRLIKSVLKASLPNITGAMTATQAQLNNVAADVFNVSIQTGSIGYVSGSGGAVTQLTSKSTAVTINTPSGQITTHNSGLIGGAYATFTVNNTTIDATDVIVLTGGANASNYRLDVSYRTTDRFDVRITNITGGASSLTEAIVFSFAAFKAAIA